VPAACAFYYVVGLTFSSVTRATGKFLSGRFRHRLNGVGGMTGEPRIAHPLLRLPEKEQRVSMLGRRDASRVIEANDWMRRTVGEWLSNDHPTKIRHEPTGVLAN
jgi:hypothetical protein